MQQPPQQQQPSPPQQQQAQQELPEMQLQLPPPTHTLVKSAEFVKSSVDVAQCPPPRFPEFAVIGRSNVGKSSLINMLTNRKSLAMVSKSPGETRWEGQGEEAACDSDENTAQHACSS